MWYGLAKELEAYQAVLQDTQTQLANAKAEMETPFAREKELTEKSARLKELNILLNMDQKDRSVLDECLETDTSETKNVENRNDKMGGTILVPPNNYSIMR